MRLVLVLVSLLVGPVWSSVDEHLETVLAVTQCRASCLDQFSHVIRNEDNCRKESNCLMCWETCHMLVENFPIWGPMCAVPDICLPGCQKACSFIETPKKDGPSISSTIWLRSVYEPHTDRVNLEWIPDQDLESEGTVLYSVLLKEENGKCIQIAQTTSHIVHIKRGFLSRNTSIRVVAVNATHQLSDSETSYLDSYITGMSYYTAKDSNKWKPHLHSMVKSQTSTGLLTTISWPSEQNNSESIQYEVSWNVIDDSMEITGHLYTASNTVLLTLWPDSLYSVQVNCYKMGNDLHRQSEPLIIDTKKEMMLQQTTTPEPCICETDPGEKLVMNTFAFLSAFFLTLLIIVFIWIIKSKRSRGSNLCNKQLKEKASKYRALLFGSKDLKASAPNKAGQPEKNESKPKSGIFHIV